MNAECAARSCVGGVSDLWHVTVPVSNRLKGISTVSVKGNGADIFNGGG